MKKSGKKTTSKVRRGSLKVVKSEEPVQATTKEEKHFDGKQFYSRAQKELPKHHPFFVNKLNETDVKSWGADQFETFEAIKKEVEHTKNMYTVDDLIKELDEQSDAQTTGFVRYTDVELNALALNAMETKTRKTVAEMIQEKLAEVDSLAVSASPSDAELEAIFAEPVETQESTNERHPFFYTDLKIAEPRHAHTFAELSDYQAVDGTEQTPEKKQEIKAILDEFKKNHPMRPLLTDISKNAKNQSIRKIHSLLGKTASDPLEKLYVSCSESIDMDNPTSDEEKLTYLKDLEEERVLLEERVEEAVVQVAAEKQETNEPQGIFKEIADAKAFVEKFENAYAAANVARLRAAKKLADIESVYLSCGGTGEKQILEATQASLTAAREYAVLHKIHTMTYAGLAETNIEQIDPVTLAAELAKYVVKPSIAELLKPAFDEMSPTQEQLDRVLAERQPQRYAETRQQHPSRAARAV